MIPGIYGYTGSMSGQDLLKSLGGLGWTGTLLLGHHGGSMVLLMEKGEVHTSYKLGTYGSLDELAQRFHFEPHRPSDTPLLESRFPASGIAALRALPIFGPETPLQTGISDLRALIKRLHEEAFTGSLSLAHEDQFGLAIFYKGVIGAALFERDGQFWEGNDALRNIYRYSLEPGLAPLKLYSQAAPIVQSVLGLALGQHAGKVEPSSYSGLQTSEAGYTFFRHGHAYLHIAAELIGNSRRYAFTENPADLYLPDDPPGWEEQRYLLTLRGRDALNPMTDLAMQFGDAFGESGKKILQVLNRGLTLEETALQLKLELQELKPWLERLVKDGLIRPE
ncbi:MAG: hypothetical protein JSV66_01905 [Trueperaceae bacterium]|nr:MAG: hypothetical protein JSV66_01905 [Trueperaceae bacterium]